MLACCLVFEAKGFTSKKNRRIGDPKFKAKFEELKKKKIEELIDYNQNRDRELKIIIENKLYNNLIDFFLLNLINFYK